MKTIIKLFFSLFLCLFIVNQSYAQLDQILSQLPEPKDFNNIPISERVGWGYTTEKDGTKIIILYDDSNKSKKYLSHSYIFAITIYPDKSFLIADYLFGGAARGVLVSSDGKSAITGNYFKNKKPSSYVEKCENRGRDDRWRYIPVSPSGVSLSIRKNTIFIGETTDGLESGIGMLIENNIVTKGEWKLNNGGWEPKLQPGAKKYDFNGKTIVIEGKAGRRSYAQDKDSKFTGTASADEQCVTFVYQKSSLNAMGGASTEYSYVFIDVQGTTGKEKKNIVTAAREYIWTEMNLPAKFVEYEVIYKQAACSQVKSEMLGDKPSSEFIVNSINFIRYDPDRD